MCLIGILDLKLFNQEEALKLLWYEVKEEWPGVRVLRNKQRPWVRNEEQRPGEPLIVGGTSE